MTDTPQTIKHTLRMPLGVLVDDEWKEIGMVEVPVTMHVDAAHGRTLASVNPSQEGEAVDYGTARDVGWRIRREREARGLSYRSLAEAMGEHGCAIQPSALQRMETGYPGQPEKRPKIGVEEFVALCEVFKLTPADMLRPRQATTGTDS